MVLTLKSVPEHCYFSQKNYFLQALNAFQTLFLNHEKPVHFQQNITK